MWWKVEDLKPEDEEIRLVAVNGNLNLIRDIAWYDLDGDYWENLKGEVINVLAWNDCLLPAIPEEYYDFSHT